MTELRADAIVVGSAPGGLACAGYLARCGLRVVVVAEPRGEKLPEWIEDPLLPGAGREGLLERSLRELGVPLVDRRRLAPPPAGLALALPDGRLELGAGAKQAAEEIAAHGLADPDAAEAWLARTHRALAAAREQIRAGTGAPARPGWGLPLARRGLAGAASPIGPSLPPPPRGLAAPARHVGWAVGGETGAPGGRERPSALLGAPWVDGIRVAVDPLRPLRRILRERLRALHVEWIEEAAPRIEVGRREVALRAGRAERVAAALVVAAPRAPLAALAAGSARPWRDAPPTRRWRLELFRVPASALPEPLPPALLAVTAGRAVLFRRVPDPLDPRVAWILARSEREGDAPAALAELAPFAAPAAVAVPLDPGLAWDLGPALASPAARRPSAVLADRPPIVLAGPEAAAGLGLEGELGLARRAALELAAHLGGHPLPFVP